MGSGQWAEDSRCLSYIVGAGLVPALGRPQGPPLPNRPTDALEAGLAFAVVPREIDDHRFADNVIAGDEAPAATVGRVVAVVAEDEDVARGDDHAVERVRRLLVDEGLVLRPAVDVQLAALDLDAVARDRDLRGTS